MERNIAEEANRACEGTSKKARGYPACKSHHWVGMKSCSGGRQEGCSRESSPAGYLEDASRRYYQCDGAIDAGGGIVRTKENLTV